LAMPESPRWLVMQGQLGDARRVLNKTFDSLEEAQLRLADIKEAAGISEQCNNDIVEVLKLPKGGKVWHGLIFSPTSAVCHTLLTGVEIYFFKQASGIDAVILYSPTIFGKACIKSNHDKLLATVAVGFVKTIFILVATFTLDKSCRRPLLLTSIADLGFTIMFVGMRGRPI
uniref:Polyol transporter 5-like n=1 Tax=Nicotiana tabacum TaxID=4097 RepID=A0A1S3Y9E6_TOBAC